MRTVWSSVRGVGGLSIWDQTSNCTNNRLDRHHHQSARLEVIDDHPSIDQLIIVIKVIEADYCLATDHLCSSPPPSSHPRLDGPDFGDAVIINIPQVQFGRLKNK